MLFIENTRLVSLLEKLFSWTIGAKPTSQARENVGRIANPSSRKRDGLAIRPTGKLFLACRLTTSVRDNNNHNAIELSAISFKFPAEG